MTRKHGFKEQQKIKRKKTKRAERAKCAHNERIRQKLQFEKEQQLAAKENANQTLVKESREVAKEKQDAMDSINKITTIKHIKPTPISASQLFKKQTDISDEADRKKENK